MKPKAKPATVVTAMRRAERAGTFVVSLSDGYVRVTTPDGRLTCNVDLKSRDAPPTLLRLIRACSLDGK